jgi:adenylosuccinate lyase
MGAEHCIPVAGQTYTRKLDSLVMNVLSSVAQSSAKMATDMRLLAHMRELDEPFETEQVGSSAMAYKRNPMRCERIVSLSRYVVNLASNTADTAMNQWLERTLDDSANRRLTLPEAFLACDAILTLCANVVRGCKVYPCVMQKHLREELPFMATENILMRAVSLGEDRQKLHEIIRQYSVRAAESVKLRGEDGHLLDMLLADEHFHLTPEVLDELLDVKKFVGLAPEQTHAFLNSYVYPIMESRRGDIAEGGSVRV